MCFGASGLRRQLISWFAALVFLMSFAVPASAVDFLETIQDIPLPVGFVELGDPVEFETPFGRIVETSAEGAGTIDQSIDYYKASLPAFGWALVGGPLVFERANERLYISVSQLDVVTHVDFKLVVRPASSKMND
ncbi:hypothetical protein [Hirschia litorea]|uniref:Uncharacterized protein n=1 Tax=Hirschia litorea TaxID=1199156 RepID=A0ABW2IMQ1_9PROT